MMERPDPTYQPAFPPTYDRDYEAEHGDRAPRDGTRGDEVTRERDGSKYIRPAEERDDIPGGGYAGDDPDLGWRGARDREYFG